MSNLANNAVTTLQSPAAVDGRRCRRIVPPESTETPALGRSEAGTLTPYAISRRVASLCGLLFASGRGRFAAWKPSQSLTLG